MKKILTLLLITAFVVSMTSGVVGCKKGAAPTQEELEEVYEGVPGIEEEAVEEAAPAEEEAVEEEGPQFDKDKYVFGNSQYWGTISFCRALASGVEECGEEWEEKYGISIDIYLTDAGMKDPTVQIGDLEDLFAQNLDGLFIFPSDSKVVVEPLLQIYNANNIPVVITDVGVASDEVDYVGFVMTDNRMGGNMAGELMMELVPGGGKTVILQNNPGGFVAQQRCAGFAEIMFENGYKVIQHTLPLTVESGKQVMEDVLVSDPDVVGVFGNSVETVIGAYSAMEAAGRTDIKIICFDINQKAYEMIKDGEIAAAVIQDPWYMGYWSMNQMMYYLTHQEDEIVKDYLLAPKLLTQENADEFADDPQLK